MRLNRSDIIAAAIACMFAMAALPAQAKVLKAKSTSAEGAIAMQCDSVDFRSDLVRLYGRLTGTPHTSHRIDSVSVEYPVRKAASDIDGVDMKRWFQWEDDGAIPVEIDFPAMKAANRLEVKVVTPRGEALWKITFTNKK